MSAAVQRWSSVVGRCWVGQAAASAFRACCSAGSMDSCQRVLIAVHSAAYRQRAGSYGGC
ncbi:hypothetical protein [Nonomuraea sp. NPDC049400]|uniref:hypothetical protein n=1 Tax=Nonomuraea sp. NPDC049400 TaxID=3364352 RepID=UPI0037A42F01